jgi:arylsulfatase
MHGTPMTATLKDERAPSDHLEQYYEFAGHRGFYQRGWEALAIHTPGAPFSDSEWQLYHTEADPTQLVDLQSASPDKLADLVEGWDRAAWANNVYPLGAAAGMLSPAVDELSNLPVTLTPSDHTLERFRSAMLIAERPFTIEAVLHHGDTDQGVLFAHGDQAGGYGLYCVDDEVIFAHNGYGTMTTTNAGRLRLGDNTVVVGVGLARAGQWKVDIAVNGERRAEQDGLDMIWGPLSPFEGINVGTDRRSPVWWDIYQKYGPFPYSGTLRSVTFTPGPLAPEGRQAQARALRDGLLRFD